MSALSKVITGTEQHFRANVSKKYSIAYIIPMAKIIKQLKVLFRLLILLSYSIGRILHTSTLS